MDLTTHSRLMDSVNGPQPRGYEGDVASRKTECKLYKSGNESLMSVFDVFLHIL